MCNSEFVDFECRGTIRNKLAFIWHSCFTSEQSSSYYRFNILVGMFDRWGVWTSIIFLTRDYWKTVTCFWELLLFFVYISCSNQLDLQQSVWLATISCTGNQFFSYINFFMDYNHSKRDIQYLFLICKTVKALKILLFINFTW